MVTLMADEEFISWPKILFLFRKNTCSSHPGPVIQSSADRATKQISKEGAASVH